MFIYWFIWSDYCFFHLGICLHRGFLPPTPNWLCIWFSLQFSLNFLAYTSLLLNFVLHSDWFLSPLAPFGKDASFISLVIFLPQFIRRTVFSFGFWIHFPNVWKKKIGSLEGARGKFWKLIGFNDFWNLFICIIVVGFPPVMDLVLPSLSISKNFLSTNLFWSATVVFIK